MLSLRSDVDSAPIESQLRGDGFVGSYDCNGSGAGVRGLRMQSFSRDLLPGDGGHPRMTAVAVSGLLGGVSEGQVPG